MCAGQCTLIVRRCACQVYVWGRMINFPPGPGCASLYLHTDCNNPPAQASKSGNIVWGVSSRDAVESAHWGGRRALYLGPGGVHTAQSYLLSN